MLTIEAELPIAVSPWDPATGSSSAVASAAANLQLLRALNLLTIGSRSDHGDSGSTDATHDIARIEAKVDMLLLMMGSLVAEKSQLPPARPVRFNAESIMLTIEGPYEVGDNVVATLYPSIELPRPLVLPAAISQAAPAGDSARDLILDLTSMHAALRDEFERYIFLRHRRELAARSAN